MGWLFVPTLRVSDGEETTELLVQGLETQTRLGSLGLQGGVSSLPRPPVLFLSLVEGTLLDLSVQLREALCPV